MFTSSSKVGLLALLQVLQRVIILLCPHVVDVGLLNTTGEQDVYLTFRQMALKSPI